MTSSPFQFIFPPLFPVSVIYASSAFIERQSAIISVALHPLLDGTSSPCCCLEIGPGKEITWHIPVWQISTLLCMGRKKQDLCVN